MHARTRIHIGTRISARTQGEKDAKDARDPKCKKLYYYPCGLIALSLFNDRFGVRASRPVWSLAHG